MLTFFDMRGIVHSEILATESDDPSGSLQGDFAVYSSLSTRDESFGRTNRGCFTTTMQLPEKNITELKQPPNSFDLALCELVSINRSVGHQESCDNGTEEQTSKILPAAHRS